VLALGFRITFRAQKLREEYDLDAAHVVIDDTPMGVYVEIEAEPGEIARVAALLGRDTADYQLESYASLWRRWCDRTPGTDPARMMFTDAARA
jgi:adenylate cyclase class 2